MNLLLETHALIWWLAGDERLSAPAHDAIADIENHLAVSAAPAMEMSTKFRLGKLPQIALLAQNFEAILRAQGFAELAISIRHASARNWRCLMTGWTGIRNKNRRCAGPPREWRQAHRFDG